MPKPTRRYTPPNEDDPAALAKVLGDARRAHAEANLLAQAHPHDHELAVRALALGATVKLIEGLGG